ncbi:hypothetical protein C8R47DRAFT_1302737, partial [Mycena vitilis]
LPLFAKCWIYLAALQPDRALQRAHNAPLSLLLPFGGILCWCDRRGSSPRAGESFVRPERGCEGRRHRHGICRRRRRDSGGDDDRALGASATPAASFEGCERYEGGEGDGVGRPLFSGGRDGGGAECGHRNRSGNSEGWWWVVVVVEMKSRCERRMRGQGFIRPRMSHKILLPR